MTIPRTSLSTTTPGVWASDENDDYDAVGMFIGHSGIAWPTLRGITSLASAVVWKTGREASSAAIIPGASLSVTAPGVRASDENDDSAAVGMITGYHRNNNGTDITAGLGSVF